MKTFILLWLAQITWLILHNPLPLTKFRRRLLISVQLTSFFLPRSLLLCFLQYCKVKTTQSNAMHKFVAVFENPSAPYHFWHQSYKFRIPFTDKLYPLHLPSLEIPITFDCCKCSVFTLPLSHSLESACLIISPVLPLADRNDKFPTSFIYFK